MGKSAESKEASVKSEGDERRNGAKNFDDEEEEGDEEDDDDDEGEDVYEVERVVGHKRDENGLSYHLKWKGYDSSDNTWEVESQVFCKDLVDGYWERLEASGGRRADLRGKDPVERKVGARAPREPSSTASANALLPNLPALANEKASSSSSSSSSATVAANKRASSATTTGSNKNIKRDRDGDVSMGDEARRRSRTFSVGVEEKPVDTWQPSEEWTNWTEHVNKVVDVERKKNKLVVHLRWNNGKETEHPSSEIHDKCPKVLLAFYEQHLKFSGPHN